MNSSFLRHMLFAGLMIGLMGPQAHALDTDPAAAQVPSLDDLLADTRRGIYVELSVHADGTTQLVDIGVTDVPPAATDDDPAMLFWEILDVNGEVINTRNSWDPRYEYQQGEDGEEVVLLEEGVGLFMFPFDLRIARLRLLNQQVEPVQELAVFDTRAVIAEFCNANPTDDNCVDFQPSDADGDSVVDSEDNCPSTPNPDQSDLDGDGQGDLCDPTPNGEVIPGDIDGNGIIDAGDYNSIRSALGKCEGQEGYLSAADFTDDACVAYDDYQFWSKNYYNGEVQPPGC